MQSTQWQIIPSIQRMLRVGAAVLVTMAGPLGFGQSGAADVSVVGSISSSLIQEDAKEPLRFVLTIRNNTAMTLDSVQLIKGPEGYEIKRVCLFGDKNERCSSAAEFAAAHYVLASGVMAGQSLTLWGDLNPTGAHEPEKVLMVIGWNGGQGDRKPSRSSVAVNLGENQVQSKRQRVWAWIYDFIKIFGIPLALALFAFILNSLSRRSSARAETWKQMLPVSHGYAAKFYLPLSMAAENLADALEKSNDRLAFFFLLLTLRIMSETSKEVGGFYFKDIRGETLASGCWKNFKETLLGERDSQFRQAVIASVELVQPYNTVEGFLRKFEVKSGNEAQFANRYLRECWDLFRARTKQLREETKQSNLGDVVQYLRCFYATLDFEANRPYKFWYSRSARLQMSKDTKTFLKKPPASLGLTWYETRRYLWRAREPE